MSNILKLENISKHFTNFKLKKIDFSLDAGKIMGLVGINGSGKTTTIKLILNILKPQNGKIKIFDKDSIKYEVSLKKKIGVVFDSSYFVDEWTITEVEKLFKIFYKEWDGDRFKFLYNKFKLTKEKKIKELSKGMQMKLMIACALSYNAQLLILDEPTSGLDPVSRDELLDIISDYVKDGEHSVLFSTHITSDLNKIADSITCLNNGQVFYSGEKDKFVNSFKIVKGKINKLDLNSEDKLIGIKKNGEDFTGLIKECNIQSFPNMAYEEASIDDIIVYINKGGYTNE